jgi:hypothetical protein
MRMLRGWFSGGRALGILRSRGEKGAHGWDGTDGVYINPRTFAVPLFFITHILFFSQNNLGLVLCGFSLLFFFENDQEWLHVVFASLKA